MITIQQQASQMTQDALAALFSAARSVPRDKWDWVPAAEARTVQALLYECAMTTPFYSAAAQGRMKEFASLVPDAALKELWQRRAERAQTLEGAEAVAQETFSELCRRLEEVPDEQLDDRHLHPMDPSRTVTTADLLFLAYWNLVYHTGQINYLQTLLGDTEWRL